MAPRDQEPTALGRENGRSAESPVFWGRYDKILMGGLDRCGYDGLKFKTSEGCAR
jgi:hypothetical protein